MTWDRVERLIGKENLKRLAACKVGVVGLGSGGGFVAESLAMSGVGKFVLVDDDLIEEPNIPRHVANRQYLGQPKAEVLADLIRLRNPDAEVEVRVGRIEAHMDALDDLDLLIIAVDVEQVKYIINQACLRRNLPAVYAGVYERGEGGDVVLIRPGNGPCYACWAAELREGMGPADGDEDLDYGMIGPEGTLEAEPGLWLHVVRVAGVQADFALRYLLNGADDPGLPANTVVLANNAIEIITDEITPPHSAVWVQIDRDPQCLVCGDRIRAHETDEHEAVEALSLDQLAGEMGIEVQEESEDEDSQTKQQSLRR
jgi:molybdopterin/thiamine biosynthesis adenylyltransferase